MALRDYLPFGGGDSEVTGGLEELQRFLRQQEQALSLEVEYGRPDIRGAVDGSVEPVAVFPMALYDNGVYRGEDTLIFPIPDSGLADTDAPLTRFLNDHGVSAVEDIGAVEGQVDSATVTDRGSIEVDF